MPRGKGTYGTKRGRPSKKKYQQGMEVDKADGKNIPDYVDPNPFIDRYPSMKTEPIPTRRDSIFNDGKFTTTNPETGLIETGPDPMSPEDRIKDMAIRNKMIDRDNEWDSRRKLDEQMMKEEKRPVRMPDYRKHGGVLKRGGSTRSSNVLGNGGSVSKRGGSTGRNGIL